MNNLLRKLKLIISDASLLKKIGFVLLILIFFRLGAAIPIPGVDQLRLQEFFSGNQFLGLLNIFSGGGLSNLSIVMLGLGPFITATIIMELFTMIFPRLKELYHEEGEAGRQKFNQYSRLLSIPLAVMQGFGLLVLLQRQGILVDLSFFDQMINILIVTAGSVFLMWLGELIEDYGIGNGVSILILAGIVAQIPSLAGQLLFSFDASQAPILLGAGAASLLIVAAIIAITEAERLIPVSYAKQVRGTKVYGGVSTYLPLRVNQAGVIPLIFALSILLFPQMLISFFAGSGNAIIQIVSSVLLAIINNTWVYAGLYFILVFAFTYFYTAITFDPESISSNLQKSGAFVPGIRPGRPTSEYLSKILSRITFFGALFLGIIAVLPFVMVGLTGNTSLAIGGTALLIIVSVVLETVKNIESQVVMREYE